LQLYLTGDTIRWLDPQFGLLHRGTEKLFESRNLLQALPYFDRFDYVANLFQEHAFCLAVESLHAAKTLLTAPVLIARRVFDELSRVLNHLLTLSATALDLSAMGPIFWAFEERENILELCEQASGARMHTALYRPFFFDFSVFTGSFLNELAQFLTRCSRSLSGAFLGLLNNRSLKSRLAGVGQVSKSKIQGYGLSGILARSAGVFLDQRYFNAQSTSYAGISARTFLGKRGDNLDRFLIRIKETAESFRLLSQSLQSFKLGTRTKSYSRTHTPSAVGLAFVMYKEFSKGLGSAFFRYLARGLVIAFFKKATRVLGVGGIRLQTLSYRGQLTANVAPMTLVHAVVHPSRGKFSSMESLITHFRVTSEGWPTNPGFSYQSVESPKGEVGVTLVSSGTSKPSRLKLRTPVSHNMHLIPTVSIGSIFADFVATFCSLDIVLGEIDR
jgi:NADH:ubiquinone oxidoreductase subunit D